MPTYGYRCPACGHEFEKLQNITDDTRAKCPNCGKRGERLISGGAAIVFKCSGFYETDYKRAGSKPKETASSSDKAKSDSGKEVKKTKSDDKSPGSGKPKGEGS